MPYDRGNVFIAKNTTIGILRQDPALNENDTVYNSVAGVFNHLKILENRIAAVEKQLEEYNSDGHEDGEQEMTFLQKLLDSHDSLIKEFTDKGGYEYESKIKSTLEFLGFPEDLWGQRIHTLSGGQKTRVGLTKLFLSEPDMLLLDEPTNHVDVSNLEWLESYLKSYRKTVLIISHDRYFLDNVAEKIIELENTKATVYKGNYTDFVNKKAEDREIRQHQYEIQQREIARLEEMIRVLKDRGTEKSVRTARSKQKSLDRMEKVEKVEKLPDKINIAFGDKDKTNRLIRALESGNDVLSVVELAKSFPPKKLFKNLSFEVKKRDNFFIIGPNGCGKSTLLKIFTENLPADKGRFYFGYNVRLGYYDQENQHLDDENTVLDELWDTYDDMRLVEVRNILASFLFRQDDVSKKVKVLSGGERARLTMAKLMLEKSNVLLLDEPTKHLDINSREALETALLEFKGTIIAVSHDRYFIKKLATRIFEMSPSYEKGYFDFRDGYEEFLRYKKNYLANTDKTGGSPILSGNEDKIREYEEQKQKKRRQDQIEREVKKIETEIKKAEKRLAELDFMIKDDEIEADYVKLNEIYEEKDILDEELESLYQKFYEYEDAFGEI
jgi:ATP-binding cassette subfamily F protein 3